MALPGGGKPAERGGFGTQKARKLLNYSGIKFHYICSAMQQYRGKSVTPSRENDVTVAAFWTSNTAVQ